MWVSLVKDKESEVTHQSKWCSWDLKSGSLGPEPVILEPLPLPGFKSNYNGGSTGEHHHWVLGLLFDVDLL